MKKEKEMRRHHKLTSQERIVVAHSIGGSSFFVKFDTPRYAPPKPLAKDLDGPEQSGPCPLPSNCRIL